MVFANDPAGQEMSLKGRWTTPPQMAGFGLWGYNGVAETRIKPREIRIGSG